MLLTLFSPKSGLSQYGGVDSKRVARVDAEIRVAKA